MTNATKALIISTVNLIVAPVLACLVAFGVNITDAQQAAITGGVIAVLNALLGLWVALTYKQSSRRLPDFPDFMEAEEP